MNVDGFVSTNGEEPFGQMAVQFRRLLPTEPEKCLLHHVPSLVEIAGNPLRVPGQLPFITRKGRPNPVAIVGGTVVAHPVARNMRIVSKNETHERGDC
jgi:hypothetical protein